MIKHEAHCTLNPNRKCRVCLLINGGYDTDLKELLAILPDPTEYNSQFLLSGDSEIYQKFHLALNEAYPKLREATENCPACIMATLRQKKIYLSDVPKFNYSEEMKDVFKAANKERYEGVSCY